MGESAFSIEALETANNQQIRKYFKDYLKYLKLQKDREAIHK